MCMIDYADSDGMWLAAPHEVVARKDYRCENCRRPISKGERCWTGTWLVSGDGFSTFRYCQLCVIAGHWLKSVCGGHLWGEDAILEDLAEHWHEEVQFQCRSFAHLLAGMRRGWEGCSVKKVESLTKYATAHALRVLERSGA